ncbi:MAG: OsmC family protein [Longimicrobiales bacterium]
MAGVDGKPRMVLDGDGVTGPSPAATLILAFGACTAADVVDITGKMRVTLGALDLTVEGDRAAQPPRRYTRIVLRYRAAGVAANDQDKVRRAIDLSHDKYCSVLHTLREDLEIGTHLEFV